MTVRGILGTDDFTKEGATYQDLNDTVNNLATRFYSDNTIDTIGTAVLNNTTETDLLTLTITQDDLGNNVTLEIHGSAISNNSGSGSNYTVFRLYVGGVLKATRDSRSLAGVTETVTSNFNWVETGVDVTAGNVIVKITEQRAGSASNILRQGLTVLAKNNV